MILKGFTKILFSLLFLFTMYSFVSAADLEITCNEDVKPTILKNTYPLFNLTNFSPGDTETRNIYIKNSDPVNECKIYIQGQGDQSTLGDMIEVEITDGIFQNTLNEFVKGENILIAQLNPNEEVTRNMTLTFNKVANNDYQDKKSNFDIVITSQWGAEEDEGDVLGSSTVADSSGDVLGTSTILPATGSSPYITLASMVLILLGIFLLNSKNIYLHLIKY